VSIGFAIQQRRELFFDKGAQLFEQGRQRVYQIQQLCDQCGNHHQDHQHKAKYADYGNDAGCSHARQAKFFQPVRNGIKEIGNRATNDERQKNITQQV
jgi:hypothetical protein